MTGDMGPVDGICTLSCTVFVCMYRRAFGVMRGRGTRRNLHACHNHFRAKKEESRHQSLIPTCITQTALGRCGRGRFFETTATGEEGKIETQNHRGMRHELLHNDGRRIALHYIHTEDRQILERQILLHLGVGASIFFSLLPWFFLFSFFFFFLFPCRSVGALNLGRGISSSHGIDLFLYLFPLSCLGHYSACFFSFLFLG